MDPPLRHSHVHLSTGIVMHCVEACPPATIPFKGVIICVHGYPDTWYGWRNQLRPLASAGYHVIAPDQRGYGDTSAPTQTASYAMELLVADNIALLDALGLRQAIFLGHDFGGALVWDLCLHHEDRCFAVGSVCTPFIPNNPNKNPMAKMTTGGGAGRFDYQVWHQAAEAEMEVERNIARALKIVIRSSEPDDQVRAADKALAMQPPTVKGGWLVGMPEDPPRSKMLSEADLAMYVRQFTTSGLRGPLNWYRNVVRNWEWNKKNAGRKIKHRALMITAGRDKILTAEAARRIMPPHFEQLTMEHVEEAGHWILQEKPEEVNALILKWLQSLPEVSTPPGLAMSRL